MTKAQIAEQVFIAVNGGSISPDTSVQRADILSLCPAAISWAMEEIESKEIIDNLRIYRASGTFPGLSSVIPTTERLTPEEDDERGLYRFKLKGKPYLQPKYSVQITPLKGQSYLYINSKSHLPTEFFNQKFVWVENIEGEYYAYVAGMSPPICDHLVEAVYDISVIDNNEELGLPDGVEMIAIEALTKFFSYQQDSTKDFRLNYRDGTGQESNI